MEIDQVVSEEGAVRAVVDLLSTMSGHITIGLVEQGKEKHIHKVAGNHHIRPTGFAWISVMCASATLEQKSGRSTKSSEVWYAIEIAVIDNAKLQPGDEDESYRVATANFRTMCDRVISLLYGMNTLSFGDHLYKRPHPVQDVEMFEIKKTNRSGWYESDSGLVAALVSEIKFHLKQC